MTNPDQLLQQLSGLLPSANLELNAHTPHVVLTTERWVFFSFASDHGLRCSRYDRTGWEETYGDRGYLDAEDEQEGTPAELAAWIASQNGPREPAAL